MADRNYTTKDIALLKQLYDEGQLILAPEYQRNNIWPHAAKAYLIDTILNDRPIPLIFLQRITSAQTGRPSYSVIDGQQRLRAVFEFLEEPEHAENPVMRHYKLHSLAFRRFTPQIASAGDLNTRF